MLANVNGTKLFYDVVGEKLDASTPKLKERLTLICLHGGFGFDHGYLRPGLDVLASNYNLIYIDLRGQGRSAEVDLNTITLEQVSDDIKTFCHQHGIESAVFFGHSAGGFVAQMLAINYPELVDALILCNTTSGKAFTPTQFTSVKTPLLAERADAEIMALASAMFNGGKGYTPGIQFMESFQGGLNEGERPTFQDILDHLRKEFFEKVGPYYLAPNNMDKFHEVMDYTLSHPDVMDHFVHNLLPNYDISDQIKAISAPTLIISGAFDWVCTPLASAYMEDQIELSVHIQFDESGHMPFIEEPDMFQKIVRSFINKLMTEG